MSFLSAPKLPPVQKAERLPSVTDPEVERARRSELSAAAKRRGSASTILAGRAAAQAGQGAAQVRQNLLGV